MNRKKIMAFVLSVVMVLSLFAGVNSPAIVDAATPKLKVKKVYVAPGKKVNITVKNKSGAKLTFRSKNKKIASVNAKGKVKGLKTGKAKILVKVVKKTKTTKLTCTVIVVKPAKTVTITNSAKKVIESANLYVGKTYQLKAKLTPSKSNDQIKWSSSNSSVASVSSAGKITGKSSGSAKITAKALSGKKATIKVKVTLAALTTSLKDTYANDFKIGAALNKSSFSTAEESSLIQSQFNSMTMENAMKPENVLDEEATVKKGSNTEVCINTDALDESLSLGQKYGIKMRGHCLVWYSQTPDWFFKQNYEGSTYVTKEVMTMRMESYISQVLNYCQTKYPDVVYAWDVVNEAVSDGTGDASGCRTNESLWYKTFKDSTYIEKAFEFANKYRAKDVKLFYNDYNEYIPNKMTKIYNIVKGLYEKGYLDGVGMQSHYSMDYPDVSLVKTAIEKYASISKDLEIQLTEVDIHNTDNSASGNTELANKYGELFKMLLSLDRAGSANITNVTFWGLTDGSSWLTNFKGETRYPLLFKDNFLPKKAYYSILAAAK